MKSEQKPCSDLLRDSECTSLRENRIFLFSYRYLQVHLLKARTWTCISCLYRTHLSSDVKMFFKYWFFVHKKYLYKANFWRRTRSCTPFLHPESLNPPTQAFLVHSRLKYGDFRNYLFPFLKKDQRVAHRRSQKSLRVSQCFHPFLKTTGASPPLPKTEP